MAGTYAWSAGEMADGFDVVAGSVVNKSSVIVLMKLGT
jgi:hypothetical protein